MKPYQLAYAAVVAISAGSAQAATTVSFTPGGSTIDPSTQIFQNFDGFTPGQAIGTRAYALGSSQPGVGLRPAYGSTGNFADVILGGSYTVTFAPTSVFSFVLGSLDTYNSLTLSYADGTSFTYNGGAIVNDPSFDTGNPSSTETNGVVTYRVTSGSLLTGATFASSGDSFEFDNLATAVPEPAAWAMLILGMGCVGYSLRRRQGVGRVSYAA